MTIYKEHNVSLHKNAELNKLTQKKRLASNLQEIMRTGKNRTWFDYELGKYTLNA